MKRNKQTSETKIKKQQDRFLLFLLDIQKMDLKMCVLEQLCSWLMAL